MSALTGTTQRLAFDLTRRDDVVDSSTGEEIRLWQAGRTLFQCGLFRDDPSEESIVDDMSDFVSATLIVRRKDANGTALINKTVTSFAVPTFEEWDEESGQHFTIPLTETETNQTLPHNGTLRVYYIVQVTTTSGSYVAGQGYGEIVNVGLSAGAPTPPVADPYIFNGAVTMGSLTVTGTIIAAGGITGNIASSGIQFLDYEDGTWHGIDFTGVTNSTAELNAALDAAKDSGRDLYLPDGVIAVSSEIVIDASVRIRGNRQGHYDPTFAVAGGTTIKWIGVSGGTMVSVTNVGPIGQGISNILLDCNNLASFGLVLDGTTAGSYENLAITRFTGDGAGLHLKANTTFTNSRNSFKNLTLVSGNDDGCCLWLSGDLSSTGNSCWNSFDNSLIIHGGSRDGIWLGFCDNLRFIGTEIYRDRGAPATGAGVRVLPTEHTNFPSGNIFFGLSAGDGGWVQPNTTPLDQIPAIIYGYQKDNGEPEPDLNGTNLFWIDNGGTVHANRLYLQADLNVAGGGTNPIGIYARSTNATFSSIIGCLASDYFSGPSATGTFMQQFGNSASGTTFGLSNAGLGAVFFQNVTAGFLGTNNNTPMQIASGTAASITLGIAGGLPSIRGTNALRTRVYNNADLSIPSGVETSLTFNTELYDNDTIHSTGSNTSRLTCKSAGTYCIIGSVSFDINNTGYRFASIRYNGATTLDTRTIPATDANYTSIGVMTMLDLAVNDYVELRVGHNAGTDLLVKSFYAWSPQFMMFRVA